MMSPRILSLLIGLAAFHAVSADRYALLVGNSTAAGNFATLKYVHNDLSSLQNILTDFCGFSPQHVVLLYDRSPYDLDQELADMVGRLPAGSGNLFLFYYSGHADATALKMGDADFPLAKLKEKITSFPADIRIGVFDACQSGSFTRIKGGTLSEPFLFRDDGKTKGQVILCSSSINENAQESDLYGNSVFTFHFVNALRGSADMAGDGRITLSEAYQYSYNHTISSTAGSAGGVQHPSYQFRIQGEGDIVLADLNIRTRGILLSGDVEGDITVVSDKGSVVADLTKKPNAAVMIALGPGAYKVMNAQGGLRFLARAGVTEQSVATIRKSDFHPVQSSPSSAKGEERGRGAQVGITLSGGSGAYDLSSLSSGLSRQFAGFAAFSMSPPFSYKKYQVMPLVAGEVIVRNRFEAHLGFGGIAAASSADCAGQRFNQPDNSFYACRLHVQQTLNVKIIDIGGGYRFQNRFVRNASIHAGICVYEPELTVSSVFTDSLYNVETAGSETRTATAVVPYAALGYTWPALRFLDIGAKVRYRYQYRPVDFSAGYSGALPESAVPATSPPSCSFGGFDGSVFINIHLAFERREEQP
jgi:hypothetical protein